MRYLQMPMQGEINSSLAEEHWASRNVDLNWTFKVCKNNISVYSSMVKDSVWQAIKTVTVIPGRKEDIVGLLTNDDRMGEFDDMFDHYKFIKRIDAQTAIRRICFAPMWPTAARDFIVCTTWRELDDGSVLIISTSVDDDTYYPQQRGFVRGTVQLSGYRVEPYRPDRLVDISDVTQSSSSSPLSSSSDTSSSSSSTSQSPQLSPQSPSSGSSGSNSRHPTSSSTAPTESDQKPPTHKPHTNKHSPNNKINTMDRYLQPNCCKVTLVAHTELGGTLPASIVNMLSTTAPLKMVQAIRELSKSK